MENPSKFFSGARPAGPLDCVTQLPENWRLAQAAHTELLLMGMPRVNLLLIGSDGVLRNILQTLELHEPIVSWSPGQQLVLPSVARTKTMILHRVGDLTHRDQVRLLVWLEEAVGRTQVISTTSTPLHPHADGRDFIDTLYYRLNTVCVDVSA
jgi:hypothetical protein